MFFRSFLFAFLFSVASFGQSLDTIIESPFSQIKIIYSVNGSTGEKSGFFKRYYSDKLQQEGSYKDGKRDGNWKCYSIEGMILSEGKYVNGKKDGIWKNYYSSGKLSCETTYRNGANFGEKGFHKNAAVSVVKSIENDSLQGITTHYYDNGKISDRENYINGKQNGPAYRYYESGQLKEERNMLNENRDGEYKFYYENGKLWEHIIYLDGGIRDVIAYNDVNGNPVNRSTIKDGNGLMVFLDKNGVPTEEINYRNSVKNGNAKTIGMVCLPPKVIISIIRKMGLGASIMIKKNCLIRRRSTPEF